VFPFFDLIPSLLPFLPRLSYSIIIIFLVLCSLFGVVSIVLSFISILGLAFGIQTPEAI